MHIPATHCGQTISLLGSEVILLALPLTAILVLQDSPLQLGILNAAQSAPFLLLSLPAGVWVDRLPPTTSLDRG
ncbi:MAG: hypothetical protein JO020_08135 [Chloroflexi bacterium]|nr:hypothetical protein [Chloroflexota bacterium]